MPGGVSSPVRAFKSVGGNPVVFDRVKGAYAWDVDGNKYIDYVGTWGPAILGHADDDVLDAVKKTMDKGKFVGVLCKCNLSFVTQKSNILCTIYLKILTNNVPYNRNRNLFRSSLPS